MTSSLFYLLKKSFWITPWVAMPCIIIGFAAMIFIAIMSIAMFLDSSDRRDVAKMPYNFFLDRIIPATAILSPTMTVLLLNTENFSWVEKFGYIIVIHCCIIVPLIFFWCRHRNWITEDDSSSATFSWKHAILYHYITLALMYLYIWVFYFSLIRFMRMGTKINIITILSKLASEEFVGGVFIVITALPNIIVWLIIVFSIFSSINKYLFSKVSILIYSLHLELLHSNIYTRIMEKVNKLGFIFFNLVCLNGNLNRDTLYESYSLLRRVINTFYYKPYLLTLLLLLTVVIEIVWTHSISIGYYSLFWLPLILVFFKSINTLHKTFFTKDVCMVDYSRRDLKKIRYPSIFWSYAEDPELFYGFSIYIPVEDHDKWQKEYDIYFYKNLVYSNAVRKKLFKRINNTRAKRGYFMTHYIRRIKAAYYSTYGVRWDYIITKYETNNY